MSHVDFSYPEVGQSIEELRHALGISQREVAAECHISLSTYHEVALGKI